MGSISKAITAPNDPVNVYYSWVTESLAKGKFLMLMFKFTDSNGNLATDTVDYAITLNAASSAIQKAGSTHNGEAMQIINEDSLKINPPNYNMLINVERFNGNNVNEHAQPISINVPS